MKVVNHKKITMTQDRFFALLEEFYRFNGDRSIAALMRSCYEKRILTAGGGTVRPMQIEFSNKPSVPGKSKTRLFVCWEIISDIIVSDFNEKADTELSDVALTAISYEDKEDIVLFTLEESEHFFCDD